MTVGLRSIFGAIGISVAVTGCGSLRTDSSPPLLVDAGQVELAIYAYVEATQQLALDANFADAKLQGNSTTISVGGNLGGFPGKAGSAAEEAVNIRGTDSSTSSPAPLLYSSDKPDNLIPHQHAVEYFLRTGTAAASMLCQEYVAGLADKQDFLNYLKKQYGFAGTLTSTAFAIYNASTISKSVLEASTSFINSSFDNYGDYRFLSPSDESVLDVALQAQQVLLTDYLKSNSAHRPETFAEAIAAMHNIEHQCTRAGLKALIDKSVQNIALKVDPVSGQVISGNK